MGYPPPVAVSSQRWLPVGIGAVALAGLLSTLLPMWSMSLPALRGSLVGLGVGVMSKSANDIQIHIGFYDWIASGRPACAVAPLALALAVAVAVASVVGEPDRTMWSVAAGASVCALIILAATAIRPQSAREITGPLAAHMSRRDMVAIQNSGHVAANMSAGLVLALVTLAVVAGLAAWQFLAMVRQTPVVGP